MGDHRASCKIEFTFHGKTVKGEWDHVNWCDNRSGIDERVLDWFQKAYDDGMDRYHTMVDKMFAKQDAEKKELEERAELERLKQKYGDK